MPLSSKKFAFAAGLVLICGVPVIAQQAMPAPGAPDPARVTAGTYNVDPEHTLVRFDVDHLGITPYFGIFGQVTGSLVLDPDNISASKVDVTIPVAQVTTASKGLTEHLLRPAADPNGTPDFFGANPADARFVSTSVVQDPDDPMEATITGNLTLNGVTKPVTLDAEFYGAGTMPEAMGGDHMIGFTADTTLKRSDFNVNMGIPMVSDEVTLDIVAAFIKQAE